MKGILVFVCAAALGVGCILPAHASPVHSSSMRIDGFSARPTTVTRKGIITFTVRVSGLTLDFKHIGKRPVPGHGHLQYYLDRIPPDAYSRADLHHNFLGAVATPVYIFTVRSSPIKFLPGKHKILVALTRNNYILYHAPSASVAISVK